MPLSSTINGLDALWIALGALALYRRGVWKRHAKDRQIRLEAAQLAVEESVHLVKEMAEVTRPVRPTSKGLDRLLDDIQFASPAEIGEAIIRRHEVEYDRRHSL